MPSFAGAVKDHSHLNESLVTGPNAQVPHDRESLIDSYRQPPGRSGCIDKKTLEYQMQTENMCFREDPNRSERSFKDLFVILSVDEGCQ